MTTPIPDATKFEDAAVLPLGIPTAACGLFQNDFLAMNAPSAPPTPTGQTLLVWGGSTSFGSKAIQLAAAASYDVVTTALPRNFDYVNSSARARRSTTGPRQSSPTSSRQSTARTGLQPQSARRRQPAA
jgi:NADPH:quinone reductase-like Zn-dependent oxidoreductase